VLQHDLFNTAAQTECKTSAKMLALTWWEDNLLTAEVNSNNYMASIPNNRGDTWSS